MQNATIEVKGDKIIITVDKSGKAYDTAKTEVVGTTNGWYPIPEEPTLAVNLTVCRKRGGAPWRQKAVVS